VGLYVHSLGELPANATRSYYVYLLDYGWKEPLGEAVRANLERMADAASKANAVVIHGPPVHFEDEVLSWHGVNGHPSEGILPAILVTTRHPSTFRAHREKHPEASQDAMLLIPLKKVCKDAQGVADLIAKLFSDIREKRVLRDFDVSKQMKAGRAGSLVDALVLEPSAFGVGVDLKKLGRLFRS
jgi:hypothetical protein